MSGNEENSIKEAGGCAAGFRGKFFKSVLRHTGILIG